MSTGALTHSRLSSLAFLYDERVRNFFYQLLTASTFAFGQVPGVFFWSALARRVPLRYLLSAAAATMAVGAIGTGLSSSLSAGIPMGFLLGFGVGGLHLILRLTWADYYGRTHLGSIRGLTLPAQIGGQAMGPIIAGFMFDATGGYELPFTIFGIAVALAAVMVLAATPPGPLVQGGASIRGSAGPARSQLGGN